MSDRIRTITAILFILSALAMIVMPAAIISERSGQTFEGADHPFRMPVPEKSHGIISINEGDMDELCQLKGVGETLATMIISERETNGPYYYPEDLTAVRGIGLKKLSGFIDDLDY